MTEPCAPTPPAPSGTLLDLLEGTVVHLHAGACPEDRTPDARDPQCPACAILTPGSESETWIEKDGAERVTIYHGTPTMRSGLTIPRTHLRALAEQIAAAITNAPSAPAPVPTIELLTEPYDGHEPEAVCPGCPHPAPAQSLAAAPAPGVDRG